MIQSSTLLVIFNNAADPQKIVLDFDQIVDFHFEKELNKIVYEPEERVLDELLSSFKNKA